jgi:hypothetical protein
MSTNDKPAQRMEFEVIADRNLKGAWRVEATNYDGDGEVYIATFSGPDAEKRAIEYARWKQRDFCKPEAA